MQKIIYFLAGPTATAAEIADIDALNALDTPAYEVAVRNGEQPNTYGAGIEQCDFVAGTVPDAYAAFTVFDVDNPPPPPLPDTETIVADGEQLAGVAPTGTYTSAVTFTVAGGVITAITLS